MYKEYLKKRIIECRKEAKMSKSELAAALNISLPTLYKWEKTGDCSLNDFLSMCKVFDLSIQIIPSKYITIL